MAGGLCLRACSLHWSQPGAVALGGRCFVVVTGVLIALSNVGARIEVNTGSHDAQVRASLERKVKQNGWKLDPSSPNVLIAEIKQGQPRQKTYTFHGRRPNETVSYTPYNHTLRIKCGEDTAWEIMTSLGAPWMISIREDSSVQEEINRSQKTSPSFFENAKIPERILDPKKRGGFGTSKVTNRGLVTVQPDVEKSG